MRLRGVLPIANALACVLFVVLREPAPAAYLAEVDEARRSGGAFFSSAITGTLACRNLYPWSEWHGGEALGVKILEIANVLALIATTIAHLLGEVLGIASLMSACQWSWILAVGFVLIASAQWWLVGTALDRLIRRSGELTP